MNRKQRRIANIKAEIYSLLTPKCVICGYSKDLDGLCVDHVYDDGGVERKVHKPSTVAYWRTILESIKAGKGRHQVLCGTCNQIKAAKVRREKEEMSVLEVSA